MFKLFTHITDFFNTINDTNWTLYARCTRCGGIIEEMYFNDKFFLPQVCGLCGITDRSKFEIIVARYKDGKLEIKNDNS